jgi:hypothetical protein
MPMKTEKISVEDYYKLHKNGNRICFDFISEIVSDCHIRLLDGDCYDTDDEPETSYILIEFYSDAIPNYYKLDAKTAFDILAQYSNLVNFTHHNRDLTERYFISKVYDYIEGKL